jgi:hypothetical protein
LPLAEAIGGKRGYLRGQLRVVNKGAVISMLAWYLDMRPLGIKPFEIKMQEIAGVVSRKRSFADAAQGNVVFAINLLGIALFYLF